MKNNLKYILASSALALLTACGGGGGGEPEAVLNIDSYIGSWQSNCHSYVANGGATYYTYTTRTFTKASSIEISMDSKNENAYTDNTCTVLVSKFVTNYTPAKYTFGKKVLYTGKMVDEVIYDDFKNPKLSGYMLVEGGKLYIVTYTLGQATNGWSVNSPYTKQ